MPIPLPGPSMPCTPTLRDPPEGQQKVREIAAKLHSKYRPEVEAERYIASFNFSSDIDTFILVEPGMGYLVSALLKYRPGCSVIVLHADCAFRDVERLSAGVSVRYPDSGISVQEFLEGAVAETSKAHIVEWRASIGVYGKACLDLVYESSCFIKRLEAGQRTVAAFGKRWVRNFFRNLTIIRRPLLYRQMDIPVLVTGSGPSLETVLPEIIAARGNIFVLASSSSVPALAAGGVFPDMVLGTDGGGWALLHLHACFRLKNAAAIKLSCAATAALPADCSVLPVLPLCDGSLWQTLAFKAAGIPSVLVRQRGTVTASAVELAFCISRGSVFMAGMDLGIDGIKSHARPYAFDAIFSGSASRMHPVYSQIFSRSFDMRSGASYDVYAAWFKSRMKAWEGQVFSVGGKQGIFEKGRSLSGFAAGTGGQGRDGKQSGDCFREFAAEGNPQQRCAAALRELIVALNAGNHAAALKKELAPLLFPSGCNVSSEEIAEELHNLALPYLWSRSG